MLSSVSRDVRYALRSLARNPGFTAVSVLALALGIGANSAIFTVVNSVLLQPLDLSRSDQLVIVHERNLPQGFPRFSLSPGNYVDYRDHNRSFTGFSSFRFGGLSLAGGAQPEQLRAVQVTREFFDVLDSKPVLGRTFTAEEMQAGHAAIISYALWQRHFGGRATAVGEVVKLDAESYTITGVLPSGFQFPNPCDVWVPLNLDQAEWAQRGGHYLQGIARLKPGVTVEAARADLNTLAARAAHDFPDTNRGWDANALFLRDAMVGQYRSMLFALLGVVGVVLLIACVNLANLLLSRSAARRREMGIRSSLGAGRGRLVRQLLTESVLLAGIGAAVGLALAWMATRLLVNFAPNLLPRTKEIGLDWRVLCFTAGVAILTGLLFGIAPAIELARTNLATVVREGGRGSSMGFRRNRLRSALVIGEVALALALLSSAGLAMRSFYRLQTADPGFDAHRVLTFQVDLPDVKYKTKDQRAVFYRRALDRLSSLPGVASAGNAQIFPLSGSDYILGLVQLGKPPLPKGTEPTVTYYSASPGYFSALRIPFKAGRNFTDRDDASAPNFAILSESAARKFYPGENPLGQKIQVTNDSKPAEIVGIVGDVHDQQMSDAGREAVYEPAALDPFGNMYFAVRTEGDPSALISPVRGVFSDLDPDLPLNDLGTVDSLVSKSIATNRFATVLASSFALLALVLALVGIYGVLSYAVAQATQEIGIRMALGAHRGDVLRLVAAHAGMLVGIGFAIGLAAALAIGQVLAASLYQVRAEDPLTYVCVGLVLVLTALVACLIPALRATRVNPLVALREE